MVHAVDLVRFSSEAAVAIDANMRVIGWNSGAEGLLGFSPGEVDGRHCGDILQAVCSSGEPICSASCEGMSCFIRGEPWSVQSCRLRHKNGEMVSASISTLVMPDDANYRSDDDAIVVVFLHDAGGTLNEPLVSTPLRIYTLGHFCLTVAGEGLVVDKWKRRKAVELLKCLVTHLGRPLHRERLVEYLWPEADMTSGWGRLKVVVSFLRKQLRASGLKEEAVETIDKSYLLRRDAVWVDADTFERLAFEGRELEKEGRTAEALTRFSNARRLYRGDFLEGDLYADWWAEERERLLEIHLEVMGGLARCHAEQGDLLEAAQICRITLFREPCRESFFQSLIEYLARLGRHDLLEAQFQKWRHVLAEEFDLEPTPETLRLYQELLGSGKKALPDASLVDGLDQAAG
jgi:DNA-binding SARP family transcriptional activator